MSAQQSPGGSSMVAADAQFSVARVLKPFDGFEAQYQGQNYDLPIACPGGADSQTTNGINGFAPNLMRGTAVPLGARLLVWIPVAITAGGGGGTIIQSYSYSFVWRLRNVRDFRQDRRPYHYPRQSPGAPDSSVAQPRFVIPAAIDTVIYEQSEPVGLYGTRAVQRAYEQTYEVAFGFENGTEVILPDGSRGIFQQGVLDPGFAGALGAGAAMFTPLWMDAAGDELIVLARRTNRPDPDNGWDFTQATQDLPFSDIYGTGNGIHDPYPDVGIYIFTGTNP